MASGQSARSGSKWPDRRTINHLRDVIAVLVARDHRGRYKNTMMGMLWSVASPVLFLLTFYFLFKVVLDLKIPRFASYVFTGIVVWTWLQASLSEAVSCISGNGSLVSQPRFPTNVLPVVPVASNFIYFLLSLPLLLAILLVEGGTMHVEMLFLPVLFVVQGLFILGAAYFVAALNVTFRDTQYILPILLQLAYFTTPIFYELKQVPPSFRMVLQMNPMTEIISYYRLVLMDGMLPPMLHVAEILAIALALLVAGYHYFRHAALRFLEEI